MKGLPYTKTTTFSFAGAIHPSEEAALKAALDEILGNPGVATSVLKECCALAPLLARACELGMGKPEAAQGPVAS